MSAGIANGVFPPFHLSRSRCSFYSSLYRQMSMVFRVSGYGSRDSFYLSVMRYRSCNTMYFQLQFMVKKLSSRP